MRLQLPSHPQTLGKSHQVLLSPGRLGRARQLPRKGCAPGICGTWTPSKGKSSGNPGEPHAGEAAEVRESAGMGEATTISLYPESLFCLCNLLGNTACAAPTNDQTCCTLRSRCSPELLIVESVHCFVPGRAYPLTGTSRQLLYGLSSSPQKIKLVAKPSARPGLHLLSLQDLNSALGGRG